MTDAGEEMNKQQVTLTSALLEKKQRDREEATSRHAGVSIDSDEENECPFSFRSSKMGAKN